MPHYNLRRELQVEQWGTGSFVEPMTIHEQKEFPEASQAGPMSIQSLQQFQRLRDNAFRMGVTSVDLVKSIQVAFRENMQLKDPKVPVEGEREELWIV